jgi:beta-carotene 3-hydroxylase
VAVVGVALAVTSFVAMEAVTWAVHRFVMHGAGWVLHRSHHESAAARFEANDAYPVMGAAIGMAAFAVGFNLPAPALVAVACGVTAYGAAYLFVHDCYIHGRLGRLPAVEVLERLRRAHAIHHLFGGEPFGMLLPYVPRRWRALARTVDADAAVGRDLPLAPRL